MSTPTRQRSLKDRLKDGIGLSLQKRRSTQVSSNSKGSKSYVIPTGSKTKSVDHHGYSHSPLDWNTMNNKTADEYINLPSETNNSSHKIIFKSHSDTRQLENDDKPERKQVIRTMTQPSDTITYCVQSSDTLTGIAARFDTTPSELAKLNRLCSRLIFPGQALFVPSKNSVTFEEATPTEGTSADSSGSQVEPQNIIQKSPKPGHVERVQSPPNSPTSQMLSEDEERNLDKECIERFLKINVRHITDGQGVVAGVLLVTPNAVMFDPNVSDQLVMEHGADKYGVIAPMDYVVNAAIYNDIATMFVSHAPDRPVQSPPQIYHASECSLTWPMNNLDTMTSTPRPPRTDSEQAVNGSVSDIADVSDESCRILKSSDDITRVMSTSDSTSDLDPEVFVDDANKENKVVKDVKKTEVTFEGGDGDVINAKRKEETKDDVSYSAEAEREKDKVPPELAEKGDNADHVAKLAPKQGPSNNVPVTAAATSSEQVLKESLTRKNSVLENKIKALKQLSYPLTWMESIGGTDKDKENVLPTLSQTPPSEAATQSTFSKILSSASPKTLVEFSSGFFNKNSEENSTEREEVAMTRPNANRKTGTRPASLHENMVTGNSVFYSENRRSSDKSEILDDPMVTKRQAASTDKRPHSMGENREPKVGFKSVVSVDDMPDLFASIDQLIPRPAKPCYDPPLYLCLRMGKPINKTILKSTPVMAYGKKRMKREYWFSIPRDRVDDLYSFFNHWAPNVYGDFDEEAIRKFGFELVTSEEEFSDDESKDRRGSGEGSTTQQTDEDNLNNTHSDWEIMKAPHMKFFSRLRSQVRASTDTEVVSVSDVKRQMSLEVELPLPDLIGDTEILLEEHRKTLSKHLPARAVGYAWSLIFSSSQHGFSLKSLYRKMTNFETPVMLVIMDTENNVFGAMTSCALKISDHFYGTGESFLYTFYPDFQIFKWTGENEYFIKGNMESLAIGAGDGVFGLWLDEDLYHGRSHPCKTYNNTTLSNTEDFCLKTLEAWGFVEVDTTNAIEIG